MQNNGKIRSIDMTNGPIFGKIIRFILPLIATNLLQHLYNAADMMIVGLSSDPDAVGAVGSTGSYLSLIVNLFMGFSTGVVVVVARYVGAKDSENTSRSVHTSILMGVMFGVIGGALGILFAKPIYRFMGYEDHLLELALRYSYIYLACMPFASLTNFLSGILRAKGDSKTPLYILSATGVLNILLNLFFVMVMGLSVEGVAIATAIANVASSIFLWRRLALDRDDCRVSFANLRMSRYHFGEIARIGFPAGIQNALFSLSNMIIQSSVLQVNNALTPVGSAYEPVIKGNAAASNVETFVFNALAAVTVTASTFTGQNVGIKDYRRVRKVLWQVTLISLVISIGMSGLIILLRNPLLMLYDVRPQGDILSQIAYDSAMKRVIYKWTPFFLYALMNAASGVLRGLGKSSTTAVVALIGTCILRVVWIYTVFRAFPTLEAIYLSYPISWILTGIAFYVIVLGYLKKKIRKTEPCREHLPDNEQ